MLGGRKLKEKGMPAVWSGARRLMQKDRAILWRAARRLYNGQSQHSASGLLRMAYYRVMANYLPPPIAARVVAVLCDDYARKKEYAADVWKALAPQVGQERVPGNHNTCITSHVGELAEAMNRHLAPA